jgi:hypothetical protein
MNCADVRLDEYFDGELAEAERASVDGHLASCEACRAELGRSRTLEGILKSFPVGAAPDADRFVQSVRSRSRRPAPVLRWAIAAGGLIAVAGLAFFALRGPVDVRTELVKYSEKPSTSIEDRLRSAGPAALRELEGAMDDSSVKVQFAAASLLFKLADAPTRDRVLARYQQKKESSGAWTLSEPGIDDSDDELVPITVSMAVDGRDRWAMKVLNKLNKLNRQAQCKIVSSVVTLLHSTNVEIQRHALEIVKKFDIDFPLPAVVDLLDSPELGDEALRFLRTTEALRSLSPETKRGFGKSKELWLKAIGDLK